MTTTPLRVLIVDDDALFAELVTVDLKDHNCEVVGCFPDCDAAIEFLKHNIVDCVLMDQWLAGARTGTECVHELRSASYEGTVVIITGYPQEKDIVSAINAGADDYLDKGPMMPQLFTVIKNAVQSRAEAVPWKDKNTERIKAILQEAKRRLDDIAKR